MVVQLGFADHPAQLQSGDADHGVLLVCERVMPAGNEPSVAKIMDLVMLVFADGGRGRTEPEFQDLSECAGLRLARVLPTRADHGILEVTKEPRFVALLFHPGAHVHQHLIDRLEANECQARILDIENYVHGKRHDGGEADLVYPVVALFARGLITGKQGRRERESDRR